MASRIRRIVRGQAGQSLAQYGVLLSLIGMACVIALAMLLGGYVAIHPGSVGH
jgi:hypothetical protein